MPKEAFKLGAVEREVGLDDIASHIMNFVND
jgi:chemotaxis response regulator CheB